MIVNDFDVMSVVVFRPNKADPELIVNPNTMLTLPVVLESFKPIGRRNPQIVQPCSSIEHPELPESNELDVMG